MQPHRRQPTRLPRPWDSPGKNTGAGCHFLLQCMKVESENEVAQSCPPLSDPMDCSLSGSSIHGIFQARVLEWGAIAFSAASAGDVRDTVSPLPYSCLENLMDRGAWQATVHRVAKSCTQLEWLSTHVFKIRVCMNTVCTHAVFKIKYDTHTKEVFVKDTAPDFPGVRHAYPFPVEVWDTLHVT